MPTFLGDNYAIMRHAYCGAYAPFLMPDSVTIIDRVTAVLAHEIRSRKFVEIYYSPKRPTWLTAKEVMRTLKEMGFEVTSENLSWLDNRNGITDFLIEPLLPKVNPETFVLFIGHFPDIAKYLDVVGESAFSIGFCSIRAKLFSIDA